MPDDPYKPVTFGPLASGHLLGRLCSWCARPFDVVAGKALCPNCDHPAGKSAANDSAQEAA